LPLKRFPRLVPLAGLPRDLVIHESGYVELHVAAELVDRRLVGALLDLQPHIKVRLQNHLVGVRKVVLWLHRPAHRYGRPDCGRRH